MVFLFCATLVVMQTLLSAVS